MVDALSLYNAIPGKLTLNLSWEVLSTVHLSLKYPLIDGWVGIVREDHEIAHECYQNKLEISREIIVFGGSLHPDTCDADVSSYDPRLWVENERLTLT